MRTGISSPRWMNLSASAIASTAAAAASLRIEPAMRMSRRDIGLCAVTCG